MKERVDTRLDHARFTRNRARLEATGNDSPWLVRLGEDVFTLERAHG